MNKTKLALIIIGTLLAMALVATALVLWLVPGDTNGNGSDATAPSDSQMIGDETGDNTGDTTPDINEPTVGVDVEIPGETGGNSGNSEIDFDDLLGAG